MFDFYLYDKKLVSMFIIDEKSLKINYLSVESEE